MAFYRQALRQLPDPRPQSVTPVDLQREADIRQSLWRPGDFRLSLPPGEVLGAMQQIAPHRWVADAAHGIVVGEAGGEPQHEALALAARKLGGTCWRWQATGQPTRLTLDPMTANVVARLKDAFDPDGNLPTLPMHLAG